MNSDEKEIYEYIRKQNNQELNEIVPKYYGTSDDGTSLLIEKIQPLTEMNIASNTISKVQNNLENLKLQKNSIASEKSTSSQDSLYEKFKEALKTLHENNIIHNNIKLENLGLRDDDPIFLNFEFSQIFDKNYHNLYNYDNNITRTHFVYRKLTDKKNLAELFEHDDDAKLIQQELSKKPPLISNRTGNPMSLKLPQTFLNTNFNSSSP